MVCKTIGEILSLISSTTEVYERSLKGYKKSIKMGVARYLIQVLAYLFLGGINGVIITLMAIVRHLLMYWKKFSGAVLYTWMAISIVINIYFMSDIADLFPLMATLQFTFMVRKQDARSLKYAQIINSLIWSVYHVAHRTYVYIVFDVILISIAAIRIKKGVEDK